MAQVPLEVGGRFCWKQVRIMEGLLHPVGWDTDWSLFPIRKPGSIMNPKWGERNPAGKEENEPRGEQ